jgi:hypothetical protein
VEYTTETDTSNDGDNLIDFEIVHKISEQLTRKQENHGTRQKSHYGTLHTYFGK